MAASFAVPHSPQTSSQSEGVLWAFHPTLSLLATTHEFCSGAFFSLLCIDLDEDFCIDPDEDLYIDLDEDLSRLLQNGLFGTLLGISRLVCGSGELFAEEGGWGTFYLILVRVNIHRREEFFPIQITFKIQFCRAPQAEIFCMHPTLDEISPSIGWANIGSEKTLETNSRKKKSEK